MVTKTFEENKDKIVIKQVKSSNLLDQNKQPAKWNVFTKTYLNDVLAKSTAKPNSFIENYINQMASHELNDLGIPFDYAKPSALIKYLMEVAQLKSDDIVLDFSQAQHLPLMQLSNITQKRSVSVDTS